MKLGGIDVFTEVVAAQSFSRAAKRLGMPISTVSAKVARLEARLGTTLIHRTTRKLSVTPSGRAYYNRCIRALAEISEAERELAEKSTEPSGLLTISVAADLAQFKLVPLIETYLEKYPKTSVDLKVSNQRVDMIADGIDLAVRSGSMQDSTLVVSRYFKTQVSLWASGDYLNLNGVPRSVQDLADHSLVHLTRAGDLMMMRDQAGDPVVLPGTRRLSCDDMQTVRAFVETGAGIGLLPDFIGDYPKRPLMRVLPALVTRPITASFIYAAQKFVPRSLRAFIDLAKARETE